jgi:two-component system LytT family response regulator
MKILLIDNEPQVRNVLKNMVLNWSNGLHSIEDADGVASGIIAINSFVPDIVLLDVEMDDGSGFDLLKQIENPSFQLIFTTAHNKYALQALKASAIDYLLKPIDPFELNNCLDKAIKNIKTTSLQQQLVVLMNELSHKNETGF